MTRLRTVLLAAALGLGVAACRDAPRPHDKGAAADTPRAGTRDASFAPGELEKHFAKHGSEVGAATKEEYLAKARAVVAGGPGVDTLTQADGDTCFFKEATGEFAVLSPRGVLRTYFLPRDGRRYFERQRGR